jgi:hypothetical protein
VLGTPWYVWVSIGVIAASVINIRGFRWIAAIAALLLFGEVPAGPLYLYQIGAAIALFLLVFWRNQELEEQDKAVEHIEELTRDVAALKARVVTGTSHPSAPESR